VAPVGLVVVATAQRQEVLVQQPLIRVVVAAAQALQAAMAAQAALALSSSKSPTHTLPHSLAA
jgi:hypothetical protein